MDTLDSAIQFLRSNEVPFWWLFSGNNKVGQNVKEADLGASIELLKQAVSLLPAGSYKLECSGNKNDRSGSFKFPFTKGQLNQPSTAMQSNSLNPGGLSDEAIARIRNEERFKIKVETLAEKMEKFLDEWPEYKKKIDALWQDEDGDGTPDFLEMTKKGSDFVKNAMEIKKTFEGATRF